ncbi:MAG: ISKra4 family transposase, partial [Gammaproteobacteria bacterium]
LKGKAHQLIDELEAKSEPLTVPEEQAPVRIAHRYLAARAYQLDYPRALAQGLPVGTGMIESAHKQVIQKRLKGPGMA